MQLSRMAKRIVSGVVLALVLTSAVPAQANDEAQALENAIKLFNEADYLASQELLLGLDLEALTPQQQALRNDYVNRVQVALMMCQKALDDLEDAEFALQEGDPEAAQRALHSVLDNEYAPQPVRLSAEMHLKDLQPGEPVPAEPTPVAEPAAKEQPAEEEPVPAPPVEGSGANVDQDRARVLTAEGDEMAQAGRYDEAARLYENALQYLPGYPEAVAGLERVAQHEQNILGTRSESLIDVIRREDAINWQRTETEYRTLEQTIRQQAAQEKFEQARQLVLRARQVVESGKQFADPIAKYETLRTEVDALASFVNDEERYYNERKVAEIRRQVAEQRSARIRQIEENKQRQVETLMKQARQHYKEGDLEAAINVLTQVLLIDPQYDTARWLMDSWDDLAQYEKARDIRQRQYSSTRSALLEVEKDKIAWHELLDYPHDWPEICARPTRTRPGRSSEDALLLSSLDAPVQLDFRGLPLEQAIQRLAAAENINVIVNWNDLKTAGVQRNVPIDLNLPHEIALQRALTEMLDQAGGGLVPLGYEVRDGVLNIATQRHLDQRTFTATYDIHDLLMQVPDFRDAPTLAYGDKHFRRQQQALHGQDRPWRFGDDDDDESERDPRVRDRVRQLVELIQDQVGPDSWRERGGSVGAINELNGQLVITQNSAAHGQISGLLEKLREQQNIQVGVEARFLTVSSNYLEELGLDLDIYLNQGNAGYDFIPTGIPESPITNDTVLGSNLLLPRQFSHLGYYPNAPAGQGAAFTGPGGNQVLDLGQPYGQPVLVPQSTGGAINMSQATPIPIVSNVLDLTDPSRLNSDVPGSFAGSTISPALSVFGSFLDNIQVDFLIRATQADSRTTVLTAPHLVLSNGQTAWVAVQTQTFFVSQLIPQVNVGAAAQAPQTSAVPTGAVLTVQATVSADKRYVKMNLQPGISRLLSLNTFITNIGGTAGTGFIQIPEIATTQVNTTVTIPDGGTLLIGGQKLANEVEVESGVPILSKIPILKRAYSSRAMAKDEQTLLILVKPHILVQSEQEELAFPGFGRGR